MIQVSHIHVQFILLLSAIAYCILLFVHKFGVLHCDSRSVDIIVVMAVSGACCLDICLPHALRTQFSRNNCVFLSFSTEIFK